MKKLLSHYDSLERQIKALEFFAIVLFCLYTGHGVWLVLDQAISVGEAFGRIGVIVSVLLVVKVASRQLAHNNIVREDDRRQDIVRITHHLMAVIQDLINRVSYVSKVLSKGGYPLVALTQNVDIIEKRYETLLDREIYGYISEESVDLIGKMAGSIFGMATISNGLIEALKKVDNPSIPNRKDDSINSLVAPLLDELELLDKQIKQLRETIS